MRADHRRWTSPTRRPLAFELSTSCKSHSVSVTRSRCSEVSSARGLVRRRRFGRSNDPHLVRTDRVDRGAQAGACSRRCRARDLAPDEFVRLSKDYAEIEPVAAAAREVRRLRAELEVLDGMVADPTAEPELKEMAAAEARARFAHKLPEAERALALKLLPRDAADDRAAMLEVRAGTGGDEAALFAGDLLRMYQRYAETQGWRFELISASAVRGRRLQGSDRLDQRPGRVRAAEVRKRRPPRPARAGDRKRRPHPHLGGDRRGAARGRGGRRPDRRQGSAHRRLSLVRARAASRSTPPTARSASPTCRPASSSSSRTRSRSTRTRPRR